MSELTIDKQTPDSYNADGNKSISWQEALEKGYVEGGETDESTKNSSNTDGE